MSSRWPGPRSESFASLEPCRVAVVAAHPDDEVLGLGGQLAQLPALALIHLTGGRRLSLGEIDQEAIFHLVELTRELAPLLAEVEWVITHPYEGGHPDHDAAARGAFWPDPACPESTFELDEAQRRRKRLALAQLTSQQGVVAQFATEVERLRPAPHYDFTAPPPGSALYDRFGWRMRSSLWRREAARALAALEPP